MVTIVRLSPTRTTLFLSLQMTCVSVALNFVPSEVADRIPGPRVSPMGVAVSPSKIRTIHDLTFSTTVPGVNADSFFSSTRTFTLGHVLRGTLWRISHMRRPTVPVTRTVLSKMDVKDDVMQIPVEWSRCPPFGYAFLDLIAVDRCLQFD